MKMLSQSKRPSVMMLRDYTLPAEWVYETVQQLNNGQHDDGGEETRMRRVARLVI
jgi:hypothetical protein